MMAVSRRLAALAIGTTLLTSCLQPPPPASSPTATPAPAPTAAPAATTTATATAAATAAPTAIAAWAPAPRTKTRGCVSQAGLPDAACNPGATDPRVNQADISETICRAGYTRTVRPPEAVTEKIKRDQMAAYGLQGQRLGDYELDHLISLELGGAPQDVANLWPEPWNGDGNAHQKDAVENYLHEQVCRGAMQIVDAQRAITTDWVAVYRARGLAPAQ